MFPKTTLSSSETVDYSLFSANTGSGQVKVPNSNLDGTGTLETIFTAGDNGSAIKMLIVKAVQPLTTAGMIRLFISNAADTVIR